MPLADAFEAFTLDEVVKIVLHKQLKQLPRHAADLTTAVSGRRLAGALVLGPGVSSRQTRRLNSLNSLDVKTGHHGDSFA